MTLTTRKDFEEFKRDYNVYGTHTATDRYKNEQTVKDEDPKLTIHTMWHPLTDAASIAEYGKDINKMYYCILYDKPDIDYNDIVVIDDDEYEVVTIKRYNTHIRVDVSRKKV